MKKINHNLIKHIDGYIDAIADMNCTKQREHINRAFLIKSDDMDISQISQMCLEHLDKVEILKQNQVSLSDLERIILVEILFSNLLGLQKVCNLISIQKHLEDYKRYSIFHLLDYFDFVFDAFDIDFKVTTEIKFSLAKNQEEHFFVITIEKQDIVICLFFFRQYWSENEFVILYDRLIMNETTKVL